MATLNVQEYGATGDGSSDDSGAIQSAIDDASAGDTVYLPAGEYGLEGSLNLVEIDGNRVADDITIEGDGEESIIRYLGGNGGSDALLLRFTNGPIVITLRDFVIDGNRSVVSGDPNGHCIRADGSVDSSSTDVLIENVLIENAYSTGISWRSRNTTIRNVSAVNNGNHGISYRNNGGATPGEEFILENCYLSENSARERGFYGADTATGSVIVRDCVINENGGGGTKTSTGGEIDARYERVRMDGNGGHPHLSTSGDSGTTVFEDCVMSNNGSSLRLSYVDYYVEGELVVTGASDDGIIITSDGNLAGAETVWCSHNSGSGIWGSPGSIDVYNHYNNDGGAGAGSLSIGEQSESEKTDIEGVPTSDEVGAWANGDSSEPEPDPEPDPEPEPEPPATLATTGGVLQASGGVIVTVGAGSSPDSGSEGIVDDFEGYDVETPLSETDAWTAAGSYDANHTVTDLASATGSQSVYVSGSSSYNAIQSLESDGLENYPSTDCTIRIAVYLEAGSHDVAFGVPADEENYHTNCYRLRGGPFLSRSPSLKRTVDGETDVLVSLDNHFPTDTWLEHVIEFESTGSEVELTYNGYAWDSDSQEWTQFESDAHGVDPDSSFGDAAGVGLGTYAVDDGAIVFDNFRVTELGENGAPDWTPEN